MTFAAASVAVSFGLATSYLYEALRENDTAGSLARGVTDAVRRSVQGDASPGNAEE